MIRIVIENLMVISIHFIHPLHKKYESLVAESPDETVKYANDYDSFGDSTG